jgi:hypothetical protein
MIIYLGTTEMKLTYSDVYVNVNYYYATNNNAYYYKRSDLSRGEELHNNGGDSTFISEYLTGMLYEPRGNEKILLPVMIHPLDELKNIVFKKILESI